MTVESRLSPVEQLHSQTCLSFLEEDDLCIHKRISLGFEPLNCNDLNRNVVLFCRSVLCLLFTTYNKHTQKFLCLNEWNSSTCFSKTSNKTHLNSRRRTK